MSARCEKLGKYILPVFRSLIAEELVRNLNLTQVEAAKRLGTTQAAISQYLTSKRASKSTEQFGDILPKMMALAKKTAERLVSNEMNADELATYMCKICSIIGEQEVSQTTEDYAI